jgi:protein involved in temperature-dependent protein secretion
MLLVVVVTEETDETFLEVLRGESLAHEVTKVGRIEDVLEDAQRRDVDDVLANPATLDEGDDERDEAGREVDDTLKVGRSESVIRENSFPDRIHLSHHRLGVHHVELLESSRRPTVGVASREVLHSARLEEDVDL